jgi:hypothetical protein
MKYIFILFAAMIFTFHVKADVIEKKSLSGYWYSNAISSSIKIKEKRNALIIHGLEQCQGPTLFRRIDFDTYLDDIGNKIIVDCHNIIAFFPIHRNDYDRRIIFEKSQHPKKHHQNHNPNHHSDQYNDDGDYIYNYKNNSDEPPHVSNYNSNPINWANFSEIVVGSWMIENDRISIAIIDTRDGLKAKFSGSSEWVTYFQSQENDSIFIDSKGNRYVFDGSKSAKWIPIDKKKSIISLIKISQIPKY